MRCLAVLLATVLAAGAAHANDAARGLSDQWNALLQKHVRPNGGVDYAQLSKDLPALDDFIKNHAALDLKGQSDAVKKTVYINLYNAVMMANLLKHAREEKIDVSSAKFQEIEVNKIKTPGGNIWSGDWKVKLAGVDVNLDDIEHNLIRGKGTGALEPLKVKELDPRIHAAVNCAAMSCPRVREAAYRVETLDQMLDENMREYLSTEAQFSKVDEDTMRANQIVFWYYEDFEDYGAAKKLGGAGGYLKQFIKADAKDAVWKAKHLVDNFNDRGKVSLKLSSAFEFHYDWKVNDVRNRK